MNHLRRSNIITACLFALSILILTATFTYSVNITVLKDWRLTLPQGDIHAGDTIVIGSVYTKVHAVTGNATRYLDCKDGNGNFIKYKLSTAVADNGPGSTGTGILITLPDTFVEGTSLPTDCYFSINTAYRVYPWRTVTEFAQTKDFILLPKSEGSASESLSTTPQSQSQSSSESQTQSAGSAQSSSSTNSTSNVNPQQSNSPQQGSDNSTPMPVPHPTIIQRILTPITNLLGGL